MIQPVQKFIEKLTRGVLHTVIPLCMILGFAAPAHATRGGDVLWQYADVLTGKQEATASVMDSHGNVIITGYQNVAGGVNDDYWTVKFKADGSGVAWRASFDKAAGTDQAAAVAAAADANDDVVVTGYAWNGVNYDIHTIKYDGATGAVIWQHTFNAPANGNDQGTAIAIDSSNNVYVGGFSQNGSGDDDFVILKYSPGGGDPVWQTRYAGPSGADRLTAIAVGATGVAATGKSWNGTAYDMLTLKLDLAGNKIWETRKTGSGDGCGKQVKFGSSGKVMVAGSIGNGTDLDIYTATYNGDTGAVVWEKSYNGAYDDEPYGLVQDAAGDIYITGYTWTLTGNNDFYTAKYSGSNGTLLWEKLFDSGNGNTDTAVATGIVLDGQGGVFVTGFTVTDGNYDFQTLKYGADTGNQLWQRNFNGAAGRNERPVGIALAPSGAVTVSGWSESADKGMDYFVIAYDRGSIDPPTSLSAETLADVSIRLSWVDNSANEDGFIVERKLGEAGTYEQIATVAANVTTYTDPGAGLLPNNYYYYRVKSHNAASGDSYPSNEAHALTLYVNFLPPAWSYIYDNPDHAEDYAVGIAVGPDNNPIVAGTSLRAVGGYDYLTTKLDASAKTKIWEDLYDDADSEIDVAKCIAVDRDGSAVVSGFSSLYFAPAKGNINSIFTMKYPVAGPPAAWGVQYNGPGAIDDRATAIATTTDGSGNVIVIGYGKNAAGNTDIYVIKYNADGTKAWSITPFDGGSDDIPRSVAVGPDGSIFVTGSSERGSSNLYNFFTAKYNGATGENIWTDLYSVNPGGDNVATSLAIDSAGDVYVTGYATNAAGNRDIYTIKYNGTSSTVIRLWQHPVDGAAHGDDSGAGIKVDPIDGAVVVAGTTLTAAGDNDFTVLRYSPAGALLWQKTLQRHEYDDHVTAMTVDSSGYIYVTGNTSNGNTIDVASVIYDYDGTFLGATVFNGAANGNDDASGIAVNYRGEAFIAGYSTNALGNTDSLVVKQVNNYILVPAPFTVTTPADSTKLNLSWQNNTANTSLSIERTVGPVSESSAWTLVNGSIAPGTLAHQDSGLNPNTTYCYRIRAYNGSLSSRKIVSCGTTTVPAPVLNPVTAVSATAVDLSWADVTGNTGYTVERSADGSTWSTLSTLAANTTLYHDTSLAAGTVYYYRLTAKNSAGSSLPSGVQIAPSLNAVTVVSPTRIDLSWAAATGITGYRLERSIDSVTWSVLASPGAAVTTYSDTTLAPATAASYRLSAVTASGVSGPSFVRSGTTPLPTPSLQSATAVSTTQVNLAWTDVTGETGGFIIYEQSCNSNNSGNEVSYCQAGYNWAWGAWTQVGTTAAAVTNFSRTGLNPGYSYQYYVVARTTSGVTSAASNVRLAWSIPAAPVLAVPSAPSDTTVNLSWNDVAGDNGYVVERKSGTTGTYAVVKNNGQNTTSWTDTLVLGQSEYCYRVKTSGVSAQSAYSNEQCITTPSTGPIVSTLTATTNATVTWPNVTGNVGYEIRRAYYTDCNRPDRAGNIYYQTWSGWTTVGATVQDVATFTDTSAVAGNTYKYSVRALLPGGSATGWGTDGGKFVTIIPPVPTGLYVSGLSDTQINANWNNGCGETNFGIRYKQRSGADCATEDWSTGVTENLSVPMNSPAASASAVTASVAYCFQVEGLNASGASGWSPAVTYLPPPALTIPPEGITQSSINLTWTHVPGNGGYRVERSLDNITYSLSATKTANTTSHPDSGLTAGRTYYYRIRTINGSNQSSPSAVQTATTLAPLPPVLNAPSNVTTSQVTLTWNDVSGNYGYKVERSVDNTNWTQVALPVQGVTTYTDVSLAAGTVYYYRVSTKRGSGDFSAPSGTQSVMTLLAAPVVSLTVASEGKMDLKWPLIYNATSYRVYRAVGSQSSALLTELPRAYSTSYCGYGYPTTACPSPTPNSTNFSDAGLTEDTAYCYQISAFNSTVGESAASATVCSKTPSVGGPNLVAATAENSMKVNLSWTYDPSACTPVPCNTPEGFEVWKQLWNGEWALKARILNAVAYTDASNIEPQKAYTYRIRAFRGADYSPYSNQASATTSAFTSSDQPCAVPQPNAPVFTSVPVTTAQEGVQYSYTLIASAPGGGGITFGLAAKPSGMAISSGGVISWTPGHGESGNQSVSVTATDGAGRVSYQNFTVSVIRINGAPTFTTTPVTSAAEKRSYTYTAKAADPDGDTLVYSLTAAPTGMTIEAGTGKITWTPTTAQVGSHPVTIMASDSPQSRDLNFTPLTAAQSFTITVEPNHPPVINSTPVTSATENVLYTYAVAASDPDADTLTYALTASPTGMTISAAGVISWTPDYNQAEVASPSLTVKVTDARGLYTTQTFTITVADTRRPPVITSTPRTLASIGGTYTYQVTATDPDGNAITGYAITTGPAGMTVSGTGLVSWTPTEVRSAIPVTVQVSDPYLYTVQSYTIDVMDAEPPPVPTPIPLSANTGCGTTTTVRPSWNPVTAISGNTVEYKVQFGTEPEGAWQTATTSTVAYTVNASTAYSWKVKSRDAGTLLESAWSAVNTFTVVNGWNCNCDNSCGGSSCPLVYSWNGTSYTYETDLQGPAISQYKKGARNVTLYQPSYIVLGSLAPDANQQYRVKIWESLQEATFLDEAKLIAVDYPAGYEIVSSGAENTYYYGYNQPFRIYTVKNPVLPLTAIDKYGNDVLPSVTAIDNKPASMAPDDPDNYYTFDFGAIQHPENAKLVIDGWQDINSKIYLSTITIQPYVEVVDQNGVWTKVKSFGMPAGDLKTMIVELGNVFPTSDHRIRVHLGIKKAQIWVVDRIRLDDSAPADVRIQSVYPITADLQTGGHAIKLMTSPTNRIIVGDDLPLNPSFFGYGNFTRYGDVKDLLTGRDDKYVVMNYADKLDLIFPALAAPQQGMTRGFILKADNYYKEFKEYKYVEPLPFHDMTDYPYFPPETYPADEDHTRYRLEYNTREVKE